MSSSFVKGRLKASREAIQAKEWESAIGAANQALEEESDNYNALVFRGLALLNVGKHQEGEQSYRHAITLQPKQALAWQGLDKHYVETSNWSALADIIVQQMELSAEEEDSATKLAELQQRLVHVQREHGTQRQVAQALSNYLVGSRFYDVLSSLPVPDQTNPAATTTFEAQMAIHVDSLAILLEIIAIYEYSEKNTLEREIEKRKTRLDVAGKSREQLRNDIGIEIWEESLLPGLFEQVLAHSRATDEERRDAEHKLLLYRLQLLRALPNPRARIAAPSGTAANVSGQEEKDAHQQKRKDAALASVLDLARGIVTIDVPDEVAWTHILNWTDAFYWGEYDFSRFRSFINHFPRSGLSTSLRALLVASCDAQYLKEQKELHEKTDVEGKTADPLSLALDGLEQAPTSILSHRIAASLYSYDKDWLSCSEVATAGSSLVRRAEATYGVDLSQTRAAFDSTLALSLTFLYPPQHHMRATRLCDSVLQCKPQDIDTLLSRALIQQSAERWLQARALFAQVEQLSLAEEESDETSNKRLLSVFEEPVREAHLQAAWCNVHLGRLEEAETELRAGLQDIQKDTSQAPTEEARTWWRLGYCLWQRGGEFRSDRSQAFTCFITALKKDALFAPAFTSLGIYYQETAEPPDAQRASKCFQKAFELDATESVAARRLARFYAEEDDWDLVDLVARRTVEAEGGSWVLKGNDSSAARRHATGNAWAWSAIGSTELVRGNHEKAIVAFQVALRKNPDHAHLWMRLGEAYAASQRLSAAVRTFERAHSLQKCDEQWQSLYSIAVIQLQMGLHDDAVYALERLVQSRPDDIKMRAICAAARLERARHDGSEGFILRASRAVKHAVAEALSVLTQDDGVDTAWKVATDGLQILANDTSTDDGSDFNEFCLRPLIAIASRKGIDEGLPSITAVTYDDVNEVFNLDHGQSRVYLVAAAYLCKLRVLLFSGDEMVAGSVWMDLAVSLDALRSKGAATVFASDEALADDTKLADDCKRQALACVREALIAEPGNDVLWCSLGNLVFERGVPLAQHCYIKAIECNSKSAIPWCNLGFLYLVNDDIDLANEAFSRAQTLEPDYPPLWVGRAVLSDSKGDLENARAMFQNAYTLRPGSVLEAAYSFAASTLKAASSQDQISAPLQLQTCAFALETYLSRKPNDSSALHLSALIAERLGEVSLAVERIELAAKIIEAQYEQQETSAMAQRFAVCMVNLGRILLSDENFERAQECFEMSLGLLDDAGDARDGDSIGSELSLEITEQIRLGAHCGFGLAYAARKDWDSADESLSQALEEIGEINGVSKANGTDQSHRARETLVLLLAQVRYASGASDAAERVLTAEIAQNPNALSVKALLGALSALKGDQVQSDAVCIDLQDLLCSSNVLANEWARKSATLLCLVMVRQGKDKEAIELLRRLGPLPPELHSMLLELLVRLAIASSTDDATRLELTQLTGHEAAVLTDNLKANSANVTAKSQLSKALRLRALAFQLQSQHAVTLAETDQADVMNEESSQAFSKKYTVQSLLVEPERDCNWDLLALMSP